MPTAAREAEIVWEDRRAHRVRHFTASAPPARRAVLVRHGETEWSATGRHTSRTDLPLLPVAKRRAQEVGETLSTMTFALVLCSPLQRARETCELAGFGTVAELCEHLRKWDYGEYEGLTTPQIRERDPGWRLWRDGCPGGESPAEVGLRADRVLARIAALEAGDALVFAHGHILRVVGARWADLEPAGGGRLALGVASISVLGHEHGVRVLERWNCVSP